MAPSTPDLCLTSGQHPEGRAGKLSGAHLRHRHLGVADPSRPYRGSGGVFSVFLMFLHTKAVPPILCLEGQLPLALALRLRIQYRNN